MVIPDPSIQGQCSLPLCSPLPEPADCPPRDTHAHNSHHRSVSEAGRRPAKPPSQDIWQQGGEASLQHQGEQSRPHKDRRDQSLPPGQTPHLALSPSPAQSLLCWVDDGGMSKRVNE